MQIKSKRKETNGGLLVASASLNLSRNSLKEKCYFKASSTLKVKCGKSKGMQEKVSIMGVWCG